MAKNDDVLAKLGDIPVAISLLSRLPVCNTDSTRGARAAWAYPLVGLVVGSLAALAGYGAWALGLPAPLAALIAIATSVIVTGAMHEDGLADTADGLWGGWDREKRLEIMKDSHIGTYGVIALILGLCGRWCALWLLFQSGPEIAAAAILASAVVSRATMPVLMATLPQARASGLSHTVGSVTAPTAALGVGIAVLAATLFLGSGAFWAVIWASATTLAVLLIANKKIGGQTGDILGASQQLAEIAVLFSVVA